MPSEYPQNAVPENARKARETTAHSAVFDSVRLDATRRAGLLDAVEQSNLDRIARLVSRLLDVPTGTVTVVHPDGQTFVGAHGISPTLENRTTPLSHSYCRFVVESGLPLIVGDARVHPLTENNPAITDNEAIAYIGIPLTDTEGEIVATLCALDSKPRTWDTRDVDLMRELAELARVEIELLRMRRAAVNPPPPQTPMVVSQKMQALGELAGGIAHDFGNLLTVINAYTGLALSEVESGSSVHSHLGEVQSAAQRAARFARQLLAFARNRPASNEPVDLVGVVEDLVHMLRAALPSSVAIEIDAAADLPLYLGDRTHVEQILMNLVINARDAMPDGGTIKIGMHPRTLLPVADGADRVPPGNYIEIMVRDTGTGMDAETVSHIFEPFFTTKPEGEGTGLGLATVQSVVSGLHGTIVVNTSPGAGTEFLIYLPPSNQSPTSALGSG